MKKTYVANGKVLAVFVEIKGEKTTKRYLAYFNQLTGEKLEMKKISKVNGNEAFKKLIEKGYRKIKVEVA